MSTDTQAPRAVTGVQPDTLDYRALNAMEPEQLIAWALEHFGDRAGIVTSFQNTGCVMVDMAHRVAPAMRVLTVDTMRLHPETYAVMQAIEDRYGITVERFQPDPERVRKMVDRHGEFLFFDSEDKQQYCCQIRKVEPNERALKTLDVWFTGLRRDQSNFRQETPKVSLVEREGRELLKISPLADWSEEQVWQYVNDHKLPYNALYDQGYTSIGCVICTTPTKPWEEKRAGRWRWFNTATDENGDRKECGIHTYGSGI